MRFPLVIMLVSLPFRLVAERSSMAVMAEVMHRRTTAALVSEVYEPAPEKMGEGVARKRIWSSGAAARSLIEAPSHPLSVKGTPILAGQVAAHAPVGITLLSAMQLSSGMVSPDPAPLTHSPSTGLPVRHHSPLPIRPNEGAS